MIMEENNQKVAGATEKMTNQELVEKIEDKEEVIVMNDKKEVKETVVAGGELRPPMNNVQVAKPEPRVVASSYNAKKYDDQDPKKKGRFFVNKASTDMVNALDWNDKAGWNPKERELWELLKIKAKEIAGMVDKFCQMSELEKQMQELQEQLEEKPIENIKVEFTNSSKFAVINTQNGKVVMEDTANNVSRFLFGLAQMQ